MNCDLVNLEIVLTLTIGFGLALLFGFITNKIGLSTILGYLVAGYIIGPNSPGFVAAKNVSEEFAEVGIILMMFSVGLNFKLEELIRKKTIAITGALSQLTLSTLIGMSIALFFGWQIESSFIIGLSLGVTSTIALVKILQDKKLLNTQEGHITVGWLVVEDIATIGALLLLPLLASPGEGEPLSFMSMTLTMLSVIVKFMLLALIMFTIGKKSLNFLLTKIVKTKSQELFTLSVLSLTLMIAVGSSYIFGTSMALGAFMAGLVMGQSEIKARVSISASPLKDVFVVLFFLSIGMLFNPIVLIDNLLLFGLILICILIIKPLAAFAVALLFKKPLASALLIGASLAQIGELSFILAKEGVNIQILPPLAYDIIVASSIISLSINPLLFKWATTATSLKPSKWHKREEI